MKISLSYWPTSRATKIISWLITLTFIFNPITVNITSYSSINKIFGAAEAEATVEDTTTPTTSLSIDPPTPTGENSWYKGSAPQITLTTDEPATVYCSWGNLITNPTLTTDSNQDGKADYWSHGANTGTTATWSIDGGQKIQVTASTANKAAWSYQYITVSPGDVVSFQGMLKAADLINCSARVIFMWKDSTGTNPELRVDILDLTTASDFQQLKAENKVVPAGYNRAKIYCDVLPNDIGGTGTGWFKDMVIEKYSTAANSAGPFSAPEGINTLYYYSVDAAGNTEATKSNIVKVDTIAPNTPVLNSVGNITASNVTNVAVSGTADTSASTVLITASDGISSVTTSTASSGTFNTTMDLSTLNDGTITFTAISKDEAGNESPISLAVEASKDIPPITNYSIDPSTSTGDNGWYKGSSPQITLSSDETATVYYSWGNLINNPTLTTDPDQNGKADYWSHGANTGTTATWSIDGGQKIQVTASTANKAAWSYQYISVTPGDVVSFQGMLKSADLTNCSARIIFMWTDSTNTNPASQVAILSLTTTSDWQQLKAENKVVPAGYDRARIYCDVLPNAIGGTGTGWFKDMVIEKYSTAANQAGPFSAPEGINTLYYYSVDAAGNTESLKSNTVKVDTIAPNTPVLNSVGNITASNVTGVAVSGTASSDTTSVLISASDGVGSITTSTASSGTFNASMDLSALNDGVITFTAVAKDEAGNESPISLAVQANKDIGEVLTHKYDARGRLESITYSNGRRIDYTYDANGNLLTAVVTPPN